MRDRSNLRRGRRLLGVLVGVLVVAGAQSVSAHRSELSVEILSGQSGLSPDGTAMTLHLTTQCDPKWTIVEARVRVEQAQAWGETSFTPRCQRLTYGVTVTVPAAVGTFQTGSAQASAVLIVQQGKSKESRDSASLRARPSVSLMLGNRGTLEDGGAAVRVDVTVTCPRFASGLGGRVRVYDGQVVGTGSFGPTPCDGAPHTVTVRAQATEGTFRAGSAEAFAFVGIEEDGDIFQGADLRTIEVG